MAMSWYEHWIRRYEHRRWTTDDNRMVRPFEWGLEHLREVASDEWRVAREEGGGSRQPLADSRQQEEVARKKENENGKSKIENRDEIGAEAREFLRQYG